MWEISKWNLSVLVESLQDQKMDRGKEAQAWSLGTLQMASPQPELHWQPPNSIAGTETPAQGQDRLTESQCPRCDPTVPQGKINLHLGQQREISKDQVVFKREMSPATIIPVTGGEGELICEHLSKTFLAIKWKMIKSTKISTIQT